MNGYVMSTRYDEKLIPRFLGSFEGLKRRGEQGFLRGKQCSV
ncbi:hypothetical protein ENC_19730 [Enterobacter hormaechei]|nr:hypothetical protein ENC_19730 [Enterobacter hormaechei]